jgi:hypothetical protein
MRLREKLAWIGVILLTVVGTIGCITEQDTREAEVQRARIERAISDPGLTAEETKAIVDDAIARLDDILGRVDERTRKAIDTITGLPSSAEGGLMAAGVGVALNLWRNHTRNQRIAPLER